MLKKNGGDNRSGLVGMRQGATKAKIHASDEQTGQPFEQQSRRTVHAEREQLSVIADNPVLLVAAVSVSISRRRAGGQKKKRP